MERTSVSISLKSALSTLGVVTAIGVVLSLADLAPRSLGRLGARVLAFTVGSSAIAALIGLVFAFIGVGLTWLTGNSLFDAIGTLFIGTLLIIVAISYRQTIRAYPSGGGSYVVSRENLGETPSLVAGASLLVDYILTVAVSISAGVAATLMASLLRSGGTGYR